VAAGGGGVADVVVALADLRGGVPMSPVDYVLVGLMLTLCVRWPNRR
jgi:hypothetical protein